jgi:NADPH-dependent 2,4-dienoyl-CoA reductase/sulfur reductase-like enzyme
MEGVSTEEEHVSAEQVFVIIGAALAGASAAESLRKEGFEGRIVLLGRESQHPYIRPPLSKDYLAGSATRGSVFVHPDDWYEQNRVEFQPDVDVVSIDPAAQLVHLAGGIELGYDRLLLATGSSPRTLGIPGEELEGVHYLRTLDDSTRLHRVLEGGGHRVAVIGYGWIALEVAATARALGNEVVVLGRGELPLSAVLGEELGRVFAGLHEEHGVELRPSVTVDAIVGDGQRANGVTVGGEIVTADVVLVAAGATPEVRLAESAGLEVDDGILVDASLRTSDPRIFAAGDVANALHPVIGRRLRSEHWANALNGGAAAGRAMLGLDVSYDDIPYFYTDQFDLGMEYSGYAPLTKGAELVYRGDRDTREFIVFWVADGRVVAGMNVNVWDVNEAVQGIIRRGNRVDIAKLADESVPLDSL